MAIVRQRIGRTLEETKSECVEAYYRATSIGILTSMDASQWRMSATQATLMAALLRRTFMNERTSLIEFNNIPE